MIKDLTKNDFEIIFDVLNVYDPNDISHVYPEMGEKEFVDGVRTAWEKVFKIVQTEEKKNDSERYYYHPEEVFNRKWMGE